MTSMAKIARPLALIACGLVLASAIGSDADARKKKVGTQGGTCSCECRSDERNLSGLPKYTLDISFTESNDYNCRRNADFGGCRIPKPGGGYAAGSIHLCTFKEAGEASLGTGGVDPSGGNGPTQPFSRPGIILLPNP